MFGVVFLLLSIIGLVKSISVPVGQVHIALAGMDQDGNSNSLAISWQTEKNTVTSTVKYGTSSGAYLYTATGSSSAYYETFHHHVVLQKLEPATMYYYIVGDMEGGFSKEFQAKSAPTTSTLRNNFSFAVYGDLGVTNGEASTSFLNSLVRDGEVDFVWHGGDISYADDSFLHPGCAVKFCYEQTWDTYMNNIEPWASRVPYMVAVGNHEGYNLYLSLSLSHTHLLTFSLHPFTI